MPKPTYLDSNGNPTSTPTYLDDSGNPIGQSQAPAMSAPTAQISAYHPPTTIGGKVEELGQNFANDLRYGGESTMLGRLLKKAGAQPTTAGTSQGTGEFMASLPLGLSKVLQGAGQVAQSGKRLQGAGNVVGGALQAATIPASFASPVEAEAASKIPTQVLGSKSEAIQKFQQVMAQAKNVPVDMTGVAPVVNRAMELEQAGSKLPKVIGDFMERMTNVRRGPITYGEARDFYINATKLASGELGELTGPMKAQAAQFAHTLGSAISSAAGQVGQGANYQQAMNLYHRASQTSSVAKYLGKAAAAGAAGAAGAYGAYKLGGGVINAAK